MHATWNALAKSIDDQVVGFTLLLITAGSLSLPIALWLPAPAPASWPYLFTSTALHTVYIALLLNGYRVGELNQVYPIARGTAPLVVAVLAVWVADERLDAYRIGGVVLVAAGLISLARLRQAWARRQLAALAFAFGTGLMIATYSLVDGLGVRRAGNVGSYATWLMATEALPIAGYVLLRERDRLRAGWSATWRPAGVGGVLSLSAYAIVLWAQSRAALTAVAALRETGVVVATVIGAVAFGESFGRRRMFAATLVAAGAALLNLG
jgi:drug/metabolite transporter (DMT)-like permease